MSSYKPFEDDLVSIHCNNCNTPDKIKSVFARECDDYIEINCKACGTLMFLYTKNDNILKEYMTNNPDVFLRTLRGADLRRVNDTHT